MKFCFVKGDLCPSLGVPMSQRSKMPKEHSLDERLFRTRVAQKQNISGRAREAVQYGRRIKGFRRHGHVVSKQNMLHVISRR